MSITLIATGLNSEVNYSAAAPAKAAAKQSDSLDIDMPTAPGKKPRKRVSADSPAPAADRVSMPEKNRSPEYDETFSDIMSIFNNDK